MGGPLDLTNTPVGTMGNVYVIVEIIEGSPLRKRCNRYILAKK